MPVRRDGTALMRLRPGVLRRGTPRRPRLRDGTPRTRVRALALRTALPRGGAPRNSLPRGGRLRILLLTGGAPRRPPPMGGAPRTVLAPGGAPLRPLPTDGAPRRPRPTDGAPRTPPPTGGAWRRALRGTGARATGAWIRRDRGIARAGIRRQTRGPSRRTGITRPSTGAAGPSAARSTRCPNWPSVRRPRTRARSPSRGRRAARCWPISRTSCPRGRICQMLSWNRGQRVQKPHHWSRRAANSRGRNWRTPGWRRTRRQTSSHIPFRPATNWAGLPPKPGGCRPRVT
jgi:hypothetical protein